MIRARATTTDDRGREVDLVKPAQLARANADVAAAPALAKFLKFVTKAESQQLDWRRAPLFVVGLIVVIASRAIIGLGVPGLPTLVGIVVFWTGVGLLVFGMRALTRRTSGGSLAATAVSMGVCGSCGYTLEHLQPEPDGCVICPECGAAWKGFRITRPHYGPAREQPPRTRFIHRLTGMVPGDVHLVGKDARGAYFRMLDKRLRLLPEIRRTELGPTRVAMLRRAQCRVGIVWRSVMAFVQLAFAGFLIVRLVSMSQRQPASDRLGPMILVAVVAVIAILLAVVTVRGHLFASTRKRAVLAAALGVCNVCGRDLAAATPHPDGCVACEGCGAAWRPRTASLRSDTARPDLGGAQQRQTGPETRPPEAYDRA